MAELQQDPRESAPKPPFPQQYQEFPGIEAAMEPRPDYGEQTYRGNGRLTGKAALITGGDSGIGRAVALAFAREGADVLISYFNEDVDAQETVRTVEREGRRCVAVPGDIRSAAHCEHLVARAMEAFGHLDILVNNAAYQMHYNSIEEITEEEFDRAFRTNVYAMFFLCKAALRVIKPGGSIINTSSVETYQPLPILLPYATTKGAIVTFTKSLSKWALKQGVRVNAVAPGPVWTPLIPMSMPQEDVKTFGDTTPMGRCAQPAELAPVYVLLASQEGSYITGEVFGVTGGMFMG
ncbi:MAG: Dehydrogenases with different specificities (related to short-chain alcohol dehydrogenases) [uncultured Chloroflexi bacterium]|uniref:Dehydrogenases with different specificities (Related to short-chain alcohol dehydrogenases) n=1 Tax=uncultured Chloroflexota bacterium TaxID=166587 RepID=A0A6J4IBW9_9CHLR|nr:MAG: Dehydrogenases with different specificities (related to short-chain alcohol dehydrogenases) [uncultured Chloroflexota bacterium]